MSNENDPYSNISIEDSLEKLTAERKQRVKESYKGRLNRRLEKNFIEIVSVQVEQLKIIQGINNDIEKCVSESKKDEEDNSESNIKIGNNKKEILKNLELQRLAAVAEFEKLEDIKRSSTAAILADGRAAGLSLASSVISVAGMFFPPLMLVSSAIAIYSGLEWARSMDIANKGEINRANNIPTGAGGIIADVSNGSAGLAFGVGTGLAAFAAGAAAVIAAPVLLAASAALWMGSAIYKTVVNPTAGNALGAGASVLNAVAVGVGIGMLVAGLAVATGGIAIAVLGVLSAAMWLASSIKNYFDRNNNLEQIENIKAEHNNNNIFDNKNTNDITNSNDNSLGKKNSIEPITSSMQESLSTVAKKYMDTQTVFVQEKGHSQGQENKQEQIRNDHLRVDSPVLSHLYDQHVTKSPDTKSNSADLAMASTKELTNEGSMQSSSHTDKGPDSSTSSNSKSPRKLN